VERTSGPVAALLVVRFAAELALLVALAWAGWYLGGPVVLSVLLAIALPTAAALVWGRWVAPKAARRLADPARLGVEAALFLAAFFLVTSQAPTEPGIVLGLVMLAAYLVSLPARRVEL
jgi:hypothetical protein